MRLILIDLVSPTNRKDFDRDDVIVNKCEDSVGADTVSPLARMVSCEPFAEDSRICASIEIVLDPRGEDSCIESVHLLELLARSRSQLDSVSAWWARQGYSSSRMSSMLYLFPSSSAIAWRSSSRS